MLSCVCRPNVCAYRFLLVLDYFHVLVLFLCKCALIAQTAINKIPSAFCLCLDLCGCKTAEV